MGLPQQPDWTSQSGHVCRPPAVPPCRGRCRRHPRPAAGLALRGAVGGAARAWRVRAEAAESLRGRHGGVEVWGGGGAGGRHLLAETASPAERVRPAAHGLRLAPRPAGGGRPPPLPPPHWACGARWAPRRSCRGCSRRRWRTRRRCQVRGTGTCWPGTRAGRRAAGGVPALLAPRGPRAQGRASIGARRSGRGAPGTPGRTRGGEHGQAARREGGGAAPPGSARVPLKAAGSALCGRGEDGPRVGSWPCPNPAGRAGSDSWCLTVAPQHFAQAAVRAPRDSASRAQTILPPCQWA